ncbi:Lrp/AsnC family transcriptional regulator [Aquipuribacter hungaricus]|uniref:Lrp/AsnC family transcriptional regulator n=2 Tax=Aquipuribacter hungaricus TaxID=545624 RepID=A0ABV7WCQ0_9MICO
MDALDVALLEALVDQPRAGALELSRTLGVARATVQARVQRLEEAGVVTGYGPDVDVTAAGFGVRAFVQLEIAQGGLEQATADLAAVPGIVEAYAVTGVGDVMCTVAAASHEGLQETLLAISRSSVVARSTSVVVLSTVVAPRVLPLLRSVPRAWPPRANPPR